MHDKPDNDINPIDETRIGDMDSSPPRRPETRDPRPPHEGDERIVPRPLPPPRRSYGTAPRPISSRPSDELRERDAADYPRRPSVPRPRPTEDYPQRQRRAPGEGERRAPNPRTAPPEGDERRTPGGYPLRPDEGPKKRGRPASTERRPRPVNEYPRRKVADTPDDTQAEEDTLASGRIGGGGGRRPPTRARRRSQFAALYILLIVVSVGIAMTVFAFAFPRIFDPYRVAAEPVQTPPPTPTPLPINTRNMTGHITGISGSNIIMLDVATMTPRQFGFQEATGLLNRIGRDMEFEELSVGMLMDIQYDPDTNNLFTMRQTITRDVIPPDFRHDAEANTITVGNEVFNIIGQTLVLRRGETFPIGNISADDMVTLVVLGDTIWTIDVESARGFLQFVNFADIIDGRVVMNPIGPGIHRFANVEDEITLPEGRYNVTVEGRNIEAYITEVTIFYGQTTIVDLSNVDMGAAVLELTVAPAGSRVFINGELTSTHSALEFEFGESVSIRVERDGFYTEERTATMDTAIVSIHIALQEETPAPEMGTLSVHTMPAGAQIFINGVMMGHSPIFITDLEVGVYDILAIAGGFYEYATAVLVNPGDNTLAITLTALTPEHIPIPTPPPQDDPPPHYDPPTHDPDPEPYPPAGGYYEGE